VALCFENSLLTPDLSLLSSAAAAVMRIERAGAKLSIDSASDVGVRWNGPADGRWTAVACGGRYDGRLLAGAHAVEPHGRARCGAAGD